MKSNLACTVAPERVANDLSRFSDSEGGASCAQWGWVKAMSFLQKLFSPDGFLPHGHCYLWDPSIMWLNVISDGLIALAYLTIPVTLIYIARKRKDLPFDWMFACFGVFILACGATHALDIWTLWIPTYWLLGTTKALTAAASVATAILLVRLIPRLLAIPSPTSLRKVNAALRKEIAERRRAEEDLLQQQTELRVLFDLMPAMICFKDTKNGIRRVNQQLAKSAGKSVEEIEGKTCLEIFPHEAAKFYADDLEVIDSGAPKLGIVETVQGPEGQEYWVQTDKVPVSDKEGTVVGIVVMVQDITERRKSLLALEDAAQRLQLATEVSGTGVWDWDLRTNRILWDKQMFALYGLEHRDMTYDNWAGAVFPEELAEQAAILKETARTGGRSERQFRIRRLNDGAVRTIYSSEMAVKDAAGEPLRVVGVNRDITEQLRTEQELKEAKVVATLREGAERYSFLADTVPQIVWTARPDGCLDYYNKRWLDYTGLSLEQSKDWGWDPVVHPDDLQQIIERWTRACSTGENFESEFRLKRASDGAFRWHLGRALPRRDDRDEIVQWVGAVTDIDESKRSAEALQEDNDQLGLRVLERTSELRAAKEAAESANRAKSEFLANMSHEIRTPMNGIIGMTDLLLEAAIGSEQREYLGMLKTSGKVLLRLVNDILDFSKIEAGKLELELIQFNLRECVSAALMPLTLRAQQKGLELRTHIADDVEQFLIGDSIRLRQILLNFADNALKFTEHGSVVVQVVAEAQRNGEQCLHFSIKDTGIGIPPEKQELIFEAFAQVDGSTTRTHGGTGLGLAIASQLIEKMRGKIWIVSTTGVGTTFHFTACFHVAETLPKTSVIVPGSVPNTNATASLRILLAEDNVVNRALATAILARRGHSIAQAVNGREALASTRAESFDLILMDVQMPEMDGFETTRCIRAEEAPGRRTPIVAMTAHAMVGDRESCLAAGMDDYLSKPLDKTALLAIIEQVSAAP
jgi:two-component system sensor histidine kinase/response regulator